MESLLLTLRGSELGPVNNNLSIFSNSDCAKLGDRPKQWHLDLRFQNSYMPHLTPVLFIHLTSTCHLLWYKHKERENGHLHFQAAISKASFLPSFSSLHLLGDERVHFKTKNRPADLFMLYAQKTLFGRRRRHILEGNLSGRRNAVRGSQHKVEKRKQFLYLGCFPGTASKTELQ